MYFARPYQAVNRCSNDNNTRSIGVVSNGAQDITLSRSDSGRTKNKILTDGHSFVLQCPPTGLQKMKSDPFVYMVYRTEIRYM